MIDVDTWVFTKLSTNGALLALLPNGAASIFTSRPDSVVSTFPAVFYREDDQRDAEFVEELPTAVESTVIVDVYVNDGASPTPLAMAVAAIFQAKFWTMRMNQEIPDPAPNVRHRHMEFYRPLMPSDLIS